MNKNYVRVAREFASFLSACHEVKKRQPSAKKLWRKISLEAKLGRIDKWDTLRRLNEDEEKEEDLIMGAKVIKALRGHLSKLQHGRCCYCRRHLQNVAHARPVDHVLPRDTYPQFSLLYANLALACRDCNQLKGKNVWGIHPQNSLSYIHPKDDRDFFHPRFDVYDEHIKFSRVETNKVAASIYIGLTTRGKNLCKTLLKETSRMEFFSSGDEEFVGLLEKLELFSENFEVANLPELELFQESIQQSARRLARLGL